MSNLILFSGGVESTAMLILRKPSDIITTIRDASKNIYRNYNEEAVENISKHLKITLHYTDVAVPVEHKNSNLYQLHTFIHVAGLWLSRRPNISEVWYGLKKGEPVENVRESFDWCVDVWKYMYPKTKLVFPFKDMDKDEIWQLIPEDLKLLVVNCNEIKPCNVCNKCTELKKLRSKDGKYSKN